MCHMRSAPAANRTGLVGSVTCARYRKAMLLMGSSLFSVTKACLRISIVGRDIAVGVRGRSSMLGPVKSDKVVPTSRAKPRDGPGANPRDGPRHLLHALT